jgi:hypothetical protein
MDDQKDGRLEHNFFNALAFSLLSAKHMKISETLCFGSAEQFHNS